MLLQSFLKTYLFSMCGIYKERIGGNKKAAREIHLMKGF